MEENIVVLCTVESSDEAAAIATKLVDEQLVACVNIIDGIRSFYRWEGKVCDDPELLLVIKTSRAAFDPLEARLREIHSYDTPEIIALPIVAGHRPYLDWITASVSHS